MPPSDEAFLAEWHRIVAEKDLDATLVVGWFTFDPGAQDRASARASGDGRRA
jgi:hypothetical protein